LSPADTRVAGPLSGITVEQIGHFDPSYSRNRIIAKALTRAGARVIQTTERGTFVHRTPRLVRSVRRSPADVILVGFPGHADVAPTRLFARRHVPVILDAFVSLFETEVEDRVNAQRGSPGAWRYAIEDRLACRFADRVLLDTHAHVEFFAERLGVPRAKLRQLWVGADDDVMRPQPLPPDLQVFRVFVYGSFIPLQGMEHIVRAARILEERRVDVDFTIVGDGQTYLNVKGLSERLGVTSLRFAGRRPYAELPLLMASSHVCLGIFGTSGKASRVIPNKVFDALAVARPVITADTPAAQEVFTDGADVLLCPAGDPDALADAIEQMERDAALRESIGTAGHELFRRRFSIEALSTNVAELIRESLATYTSSR
jgi:glycosyltransferase involved in cell wall biosynthesis